MSYFKAGDSHRSEDITVILNGVPAPLAIEADAKRGWCRSYIAGPGGEILRDAMDRPQIRFESGDVRIVVQS